MPSNILLNCLHAESLIDDLQFKALTRQAQEQPGACLPTLIQTYQISSRRIAQTVSEHLQFPLENLEHFSPTPAIKKINQLLQSTQRPVLALRKTNTCLEVGFCDSQDLSEIAQLEFMTRHLIFPKICDYCQLLHCQAQHLAGHTKMPQDTEALAMLQHLIQVAATAGASDLHFEPELHHYRIRMRVDGLLQPLPAPPNKLLAPMINRLKIMAHLDITEHRRPQDGHFTVTLDAHRALHCRMSTLATHWGEKVVLRLLDGQPQALRLDALGMEAIDYNCLQSALAQPQGLILITGPTGSGKTLTLYSALKQLNNMQRNIQTIEDPIEIPLSGINQTQVNRAIGLDFARALRTFLRQDPDVIMVGEIRDQETATLAIRAAQTGHLVLATLHTQTAEMAISRLQNLGVLIDDIHACLQLVIAQRLVRKCINKSYIGRTGLFSTLVVTPKTRTLHNTLWQAAQRKINQGITDWTECKRVLGARDEKLL